MEGKDESVYYLKAEKLKAKSFINSKLSLRSYLRKNRDKSLSFREIYQKLGDLVRLVLMSSCKPDRNKIRYPIDKQLFYFSCIWTKRSFITELEHTEQGDIIFSKWYNGNEVYQLQCYSSVRYCQELESDTILWSNGSFPVTFLAIISKDCNI